MLKATSLIVVLGCAFAAPAQSLLPTPLPASLPASKSVDEIARGIAAGDPGTGNRGDAIDRLKWRKQWKVSLLPLVGSQVLDAASSYGMRELNPLLASPNGGFGMKATSVKFGAIGALIGVEYLVVRKYPRSAKFFSIVNWTTTGATTALAVHNYSLAGR